MLRESQEARPNIYQALREACVMQGKEVPVKDVCSLPDTMHFVLFPFQIF